MCPRGDFSGDGGLGFAVFCAPTGVGSGHDGDWRIPARYQPSPGEATMKKWFVIALIACVAIGAQAAGSECDAKAAPKGKAKGKEMTKEQFVAMQKKKAEKKGKEFDLAAVEKRFDKMDKNGDGKLCEAEKPAKKKGQKKKAE
jgi:hypothetical protein